MSSVDELALAGDDEEDVLVEELLGAVDELELDDDDEDSCILGAERCIAPVEELEPDEDGEFVKESNDCVKLGDLVGSDVASSDAASVFPFLLITGAAPLEVRRFIANGLQICFCMAPKTMNTVWPGTCLPQSHTSPLSVSFLPTFGVYNLLPCVLSINAFGRLRIVYTLFISILCDRVVIVASS